MENNTPNDYQTSYGKGYGKRPLWQWLLIYVVIGGILYAGAYYFFFYQKGYSYQSSQYQEQQNQQQQTTPQNQPSTAISTKVDIAIKDFAFNPAQVTVNAGTTVVWTNQDAMVHRIQSEYVNSGDLQQGDTFQYTFNIKGTHDYICGIHPSMHGKIIVE